MIRFDVSSKTTELFARAVRVQERDSFAKWSTFHLKRIHTAPVRAWRQLTYEDFHPANGQAFVLLGKRTRQGNKRSYVQSDTEKQTQEYIKKQAKIRRMSVAEFVRRYLTFIALGQTGSSINPMEEGNDWRYAKRPNWQVAEDCLRAAEERNRLPGGQMTTRVVIQPLRERLNKVHSGEHKPKAKEAMELFREIMELENA